jgi:hypothetical protein
MPGTPDFVLGSAALTFAVACLVGGAVAVVPFALRDSFPAPAALSLAGGVAYALLCLGAWVGARLVADAFVSGMTDDATALVGWLAAGAVVLGLQAGIPYYSYARWRLVGPLVALFAVTVVVVYAFLGVRGETDPLGLYVVLFGPLLVTATCLVGLAEAGVRRFVLGT